MAKLRIHFFQHAPFEGIGCIDFWAQAKGHTVNGTKFYQNDAFPLVDNIDWLIVAGGPFSVNDYEKYYWMKQERAFIEQAIKKNKTVIGICLGAQLVASVLGAKVYRNEKPEIGWHDVTLTDAAKSMEVFGSMPDTFTTFLWHEDTFDLPKNAELLMSSKACTNQAYKAGKRIFGFQFHPEITSGMITEMMEHFNHGNDIDHIMDSSSEFVQSKSEILEKANLIQSSQEWMRQFLNRLADANG